MSEESVGGILRHKDTRHVQVRLDYMLLYRNETKAKIIRIMETWTNQKRAEWYKESLDSKEQGAEPPVEELWITMSYEQFSLFAYGTMKHDNIKRNVDALVAEKHLLRRMHPAIPYGSPQYLLNIKFLQEALDEQDIPSLADDIGKIAPPRKKHTPPEKYPQGGGLNTPRVGGKIPPAGGEKSYPSNNTSKNHLDDTKNEGEAPASLIDFTEEKKKRTDPGMPVVQVATDTPSHSYRHNTIGSAEDEDDTPTEKVPVVKPSRQISLQVEQSVPSRRASPRMALRITPAPQERVPEPKPPTRRELEIQERAREKELWAIIEEERKTKYTKKQRELYENSEGMKCLITDAIPDESIRTGIRALDAFQRKSFTVLKFYGWLPNLTADDNPKRPMKAAANGDVAPRDDDYSDFDRYVGNGKEERAARRILYQEMLAKGEIV